MKFAKNTFKNLSLLRKKNWSAPAIISVFILVCMIIVYSFESIGLLNKERNLDLRISNPENIIKTTYKDLKLIYSDKLYHQINFNAEGNIHLRKDFVLNKINLQTKISKENFIENINKILIEGALAQLNFESSQSKVKEYVNSNTTLKAKLAIHYRVNIANKGNSNKENQYNSDFDNIDLKEKLNLLLAVRNNYKCKLANNFNNTEKLVNKNDNEIFYFDI